MSKKIGVALLGLGTVGSEVLTILRENKTYFEERYSLLIQVNLVYVRDLNKKRNVSLEGIELTDKMDHIVYSDRIDVCIECMGGNGTDKTYEMIMKMIEQRKSIVMSSKKCLALYREEIIKQVDRYNVQLRFDATVGGSIPICKLFQNLAGFDTVKKMYGIVNASTNYVLSLMRNQGMDLSNAIEMAKKKGYVENDPSNDLDGWDALYKMIIVLRFGLGITLKESMNDKKQEYISVVPEKLEILENENKSYDYKSDEICYKQIFYVSQISDKEFGSFVGFVNVEKNPLLANTNSSNNIIFVEHKYGGLRAYYGKGAGGKETAVVMVEDLIDAVINQGRIYDNEAIVLKQLGRDDVDVELF